jgi:hypothetical protein
MAQQKKNIARLILQGISILGIFFGFTWVCGAIISVFPIERDNGVIDYIVLIFLGALLVLGTYTIYTSYLMFRGRAFGAIYLISVSLALIPFTLVLRLVEVFAAKSDKEKILSIASLLFLVFVYLICVMLLKRLLKAAYGTKEISGAQRSTDKQ